MLQNEEKREKERPGYKMKVWRPAKVFGTRIKVNGFQGLHHGFEVMET